MESEPIRSPRGKSPQPDGSEVGKPPVLQQLLSSYAPVCAGQSHQPISLGDKEGGSRLQAPRPAGSFSLETKKEAVDFKSPDLQESFLWRQRKRQSTPSSQTCRKVFFWRQKAPKPAGIFHSNRPWADQVAMRIIVEQWLE